MKITLGLLVGLVVVVFASFLAGVALVLWVTRNLRVRVMDDDATEPLLWIASPHGPLRAPTDEELEWARLHPGERLPYIPGHGPSDPYMNPKRTGESHDA